MTEQPSQSTVYQIKVTLAETDPPIWRRFEIPSDVTLHRLHLVLQAVMGWTNSHLYRFQIGTEQYGEPDPDNEFHEVPFKNSRRTKLSTVVTASGTSFLYEYDFGDSWSHELVLEDILKRVPGQQLPACLVGERACPPEDCGGIHGYAEVLGIISNPDNEQHLDMMKWLGGQFYPASFSVERVNRNLKAMRLR